MKLIHKISDIFDGVLSLFGTLAVILITFDMLIVSALVVMRYILKRAPTWVIEFTEYSLLYITFLGAAWLLKGEGHVKMDLVISSLRPRTQAILNTITSVACAVVCLIVVWFGVKVTWNHFQTNYLLPTILRPPSYLIVCIIPIGCFMLFIQFLRRAYRYLGEFREKEKNV
ncbi:MAG: TRAP transporter small permease [Deltaproteobacteria bacterium]|nr:TRAP transporter small permease [Deltaproteobacteria bacterium]